jgi:hypothetical protein
MLGCRPLLPAVELSCVTQARRCGKAPMSDDCAAKGAGAKTTNCAEAIDCPHGRLRQNNAHARRATEWAQAGELAGEVERG